MIRAPRSVNLWRLAGMAAEFGSICAVIRVGWLVGHTAGILP